MAQPYGERGQKGVVSSLRNFLNLAEHFRGRCLVIPDLLHQSRFTDCLENPLCAKPVDVARILRNIERDAHVGLRAQIIDFIGLKIIQQLHHLHRIGEIAIVKEKFNPVHMRILVEMIDAAGVERRSAANHAVNFIPFGEQQLGQIRAILARDACDQCFFHSIEKSDRKIRRGAGKFPRIGKQPDGL